VVWNAQYSAQAPHWLSVTAELLVIKNGR